MFDLTGRTALVTGAATGLGQAIAVALTRSGAHVAISNRSDLSLDETATLCAEAGETPMPLTIDVRDLAQIAAGVAVPASGVIGLMFLALWITALRLGGRIDRERAERAVVAAGHEDDA